tara:strand:+ start:547 stop:1173 length:627 start_codon:yes stop_codon:yes gene_type:complete
MYWVRLIEECDAMRTQLHLIFQNGTALWDNKSMAPRLGGSKKRGMEALKELEKLCVRDANDKVYFDFFISVIREFRRNLPAKQRELKLDWLDINMGFFGVPDKIADVVENLKLFQCEYKIKDDGNECPPMPENYIKLPNSNDMWEYNTEEINQSCCADAEPIGVPINFTIGTMDKSAEQLDIIESLIKVFQLSREDKAKLISRIALLI